MHYMWKAKESLFSADFVVHRSPFMFIEFFLLGVITCGWSCSMAAIYTLLLALQVYD